MEGSKDMNQNIILILISLTVISSLVSPVSAEVSDLDISKVLPSLIAQGGTLFMEVLGDQLYNMGLVGNASEAQGKIMVYMGEKNNFVERPGVQEQKDFNALCFLVAYILYLGYGVARISGEKSGILNGFAAQESYTRTYVKTLGIGIVFFMFYLWGIDWACTVEWLISHGFTMNAMDIMPNDAQHGISYLIIAIANILVWAFMMSRDIIVYMVLMYVLWLICIKYIPLIGYVAYFILIVGGLLFGSRIIIAFVFMAGATAIETLGYGGFVIPYLILMLLIIVICVVILLIPIVMVISKILSTIQMRNYFHKSH